MAAYTYDPAAQPPPPQQGAPAYGYTAPPQHNAPPPQPQQAKPSFDLDDLLGSGPSPSTAAPQTSAVPPPPAHAPPPPVNNDPFGFQQQQAAAPQPPQPQPAPAQVAPPPQPQHAPAAYTYQPPAQQAVPDPASAPPMAHPAPNVPPAQPAYTYGPPPTEAPQHPPQAYAQPPQHPQAPAPTANHYAAPPHAPSEHQNPYTPPPQADPNTYAHPNPYAQQPPPAPAPAENPYPNPYAAPGAPTPGTNPYAPQGAASLPGHGAPPPDQWQRENDADRERLQKLQELKRKYEQEEQRAADLRAEKDTWPCSVCTFKTPLSEGKCGMCDAPRPGYSSSPTPTAQPPAPIPQAKVVSFNPAPTPAPVAVNNGGGPSNKWMCPNCSVANSDAANICKVCNTSKPDHPAPADPPQRNTGAPGGSGSGPSANEWACPVCTLANALTSAACNACQNPRPANIKVPAVQAVPVQAPRPSGGGGGGGMGKWSCPECTFENSKTAPKCTMCEQPQPGYVAPRVADPGAYPGAGRQPRPAARPAPQRGPQPAQDEEIKWQDDKFATNCNKCNSQFGMINRKHHCRSCGFVFCGNCSSNKAKLKPTDREEVRMCLDCFREKTSPSGGGASAPPAPGGRSGGGGGTCDCAMAAEGFHRPGCPRA